MGWLESILAAFGIWLLFMLVYISLIGT